MRAIGLILFLAATGAILGAIAAAAARNSDRPGWVGLYHFRHGYEEDAGVGIMNDYGFWRLCRFFYSSTDAPPTQEILWSWRLAPELARLYVGLLSDPRLMSREIPEDAHCLDCG